MKPAPSLSKASMIGVFSVLAACGGDNGGDNASPPPPPASTALPQLSAATGGTLPSCANLISKLSYANTTITATNDIAAGALTVGGNPVPAHCQVVGKMYQRIGLVDGQPYAIGFEMRLPYAWNGRFYLPGERRHRRLGCHGDRREHRRRAAHRRVEHGLRGHQLGRGARG